MNLEALQSEIHKTAKAAVSIPGWLWPREAGGLYWHIRNSRSHLEIGSFCGKSLYVAAAAMNGGKIIAVDPLSTAATPDQGNITPGWDWNRTVLNATITAIHEKFETRVEWWETTSIEAMRRAVDLGLIFDTCYIDGNHRKAECQADIEGWLPMIRPGGKMLGHDYIPSCMGVMEAVNEVFECKHNLIPETRIWFYEKPG